jgi:hypothetical protein
MHANVEHPSSFRLLLHEKTLRGWSQLGGAS